MIGLINTRIIFLKINKSYAMAIYINFLYVLIAFFISIFLIPKINSFGFKNNILDKPNKRKTHKAPIVRLGGVAIYSSFIVVSSIIFNRKTSKLR